MSFQSPLWLLALLVIAALVALYVMLQLRRKAYAARFTNVALLGSLVPKRPGWRRHLAFGVVALGPGHAGRLARRAEHRGAGAAGAGDGRHGRRRVAVDAGHRHRARPLPGDAEGGQGVRRRPARADQPRPGVLRRHRDQRSCRRPPTGPRWPRDRPPGPGRVDRDRRGDLHLADGHRELPVDASTPPTEDVPPARIVLLSDGYNTVGRADTQAIDAARAAGVPVSTIAFGTDYGTLDLDGETVPVPVDRTTLKADRRRHRRQLQRGGHRGRARAGLRRPGQPDRLHDRAEGRQLLVRARRRPAGPDRRRA